jgi:hypothetical protein
VLPAAAPEFCAVLVEALAVLRARLAVDRVALRRLQRDPSTLRCEQLAALVLALLNGGGVEASALVGRVLFGDVDACLGAVGKSNACAVVLRAVGAAIRVNGSTAKGGRDGGDSGEHR